MESITIDGQGEEEFRRSIEAMLRRGQADAAAARLRALIEPYAGAILPARFLSVASADVMLAGWSDLAHRIGEHDRPGHRISALGISAIANDPDGERHQPQIETRYFSDEAYPFSEASRRDLLQGYAADGSAWRNLPEGSDTALSLEGIDDLYDAVFRLEARLMDSPEPDEDEIRAGSLGACYLAVLLHQAVENAIDRGGLPRPLCVLAGTGDVYPYFDAPVVSSLECREAGLGASVPIALPSALAEARDFGDEEEGAEEEEEKDDAASGPAQSYGSLLSLGASIRAKKPVITVGETEAAAASHHYDLGAQHRLTVAGNSGRIGVLPGLAFADEREALLVPAGDPWNAPAAAASFADASRWSQPAADDASRPPPPLVRAEAAAGEVPAIAPLPSEARNDDAPADEEARFVIAQPTPGETASASEPPIVGSRSAIPAPTPHSLRSRVVQRQDQRATLTDRVLSFLQDAGRWLRRLRR